MQHQLTLHTQHNVFMHITVIIQPFKTKIALF